MVVSIGPFDRARWTDVSEAHPPVSSEDESHADALAAEDSGVLQGLATHLYRSQCGSGVAGIRTAYGLRVGAGVGHRARGPQRTPGGGTQTSLRCHYFQ